MSKSLKSVSPIRKETLVKNKILVIGELARLELINPKEIQIYRSSGNVDGTNEISPHSNIKEYRVITS